MRTGPLEITDLLWRYAPDGTRLPVERDRVVADLRERGQPHAARLVGRMPTRGTALDETFVDALGLRVHCELQRLGEELQFGRRVAATLRPMIDQLRERPVRVVDVGCGLGFVLRSIAADRTLGKGVELVGVDLNPVLIAESARLAAVEDLGVRFVTGDALAPGLAVEEPAATIMISSGLLHHLSPDELRDFFAAQAALGVAGFAHWDIAPCFWSTAGAWIFHQARMREAVSRHDGVLSARRAHPATVLHRAAAEGAPAYRADVREGPRWQPRALDVLRPVVGHRR